LVCLGFIRPLLPCDHRRAARSVDSVQYTAGSSSDLAWRSPLVGSACHPHAPGFVFVCAPGRSRGKDDRQGRSDETQPTLQDLHQHPRHNQHQLRVPPRPRRAMVQGGVGRAPLRVHRRADVQREELGWRVPSQMVRDAGESPTRLPHPFPLHPSCAARSAAILSLLDRAQLHQRPRHDHLHAALCSGLPPLATSSSVHPLVRSTIASGGLSR
jgi:hypothetical protein